MAGVVRQRELANPDFLMSYDVRPELKKLEGDFDFWIENKIYQDKELAAIFHERLLTIHPFNDGNGRWARVLTNMICEKENIGIPNWGSSISDDEKRRDQYIKAVKTARREGNYFELIEIMYYNKKKD